MWILSCPVLCEFRAAPCCVNLELPRVVRILSCPVLCEFWAAPCCANFELPRVVRILSCRVLCEFWAAACCANFELPRVVRILSCRVLCEFWAAPCYANSWSAHISPGAHPTSCSKGTGVISLCVNRPGREADRPPPLPRLRMGGDLPLLPLYTSVAWIGKTLLLYLNLLTLRRLKLIYIILVYI